MKTFIFAVTEVKKVQNDCEINVQIIDDIDLEVIENDGKQSIILGWKSPKAKTEDVFSKRFLVIDRKCFKKLIERFKSE